YTNEAENKKIPVPLRKWQCFESRHQFSRFRLINFHRILPPNRHTFWAVFRTRRALPLTRRSYQSYQAAKGQAFLPRGNSPPHRDCAANQLKGASTKINYTPGNNLYVTH